MRITTYTGRPFLLAAFVLAACPSTREIGPDAPSDVGFDAGPPEANGLDLLFMIDDSCPMAEEHVNLVAELPHLFVALSTGDVDGDGDRELGPIASLHVGVVTSDMGAGPHEGVPTCGRGLGDDGILRARSRLTTGPCRAVYPSGVFEFMPLSEASADTHAGTMGCVANVGTGGCGFEQQLESALKAVTPSQRNAGTAVGYVPPRFVSAEGVPDVESGQADRANAGFVRRDSALAIVLVTDEDDCSVRDYGLYVSGDARFSGTPLNLRCRRFGSPGQGVVHPVSRYVEGFLGLRRDPRTLAFSVITGVPPSAIDEGAEAPDFDRILTDPNMIPTENAEGTNENPACSTSNGVAYPAIRLVETARGLHAAGAQVSVSSLCTSSFRPAIDQFLVSLAPIFPPR